MLTEFLKNDTLHYDVILFAIEAAGFMGKEEFKKKPTLLLMIPLKRKTGILLLTFVFIVVCLFTMSTSYHNKLYLYLCIGEAHDTQGSSTLSRQTKHFLPQELNKQIKQILYIVNVYALANGDFLKKLYGFELFP